MTPSNLPFGERRLYHRKSCSRMIQVDDRNGSYSGHLRDLNVGGAFVEPPNQNETRIGQKLILTIPFGLKKSCLTVQAKVAWTSPKGMGVRFISPGRVD